MTHGKEVTVDVLHIWYRTWNIKKEYLLQFELCTPIYKRYIWLGCMYYELWLGKILIFL
jgi:hypothetical protein